MRSTRLLRLTSYWFRHLNWENRGNSRVDRCARRCWRLGLRLGSVAGCYGCGCGLLATTPLLRHRVGAQEVQERVAAHAAGWSGRSSGPRSGARAALRVRPGWSVWLAPRVACARLCRPPVGSLRVASLCSAFCSLDLCAIRNLKLVLVQTAAGRVRVAHAALIAASAAR